VRLVGAPGELHGVELRVLGWRSEVGETVLVCRLLDGSAGTIPARWTDLPVRGSPERSLGVVASPAAWRLLLARAGALSDVRGAVEPPRKREATMSGQLALALREETVVPAAVWETLPAEARQQVTPKLARLVARLLESAPRAAAARCD